MKFDWLLSGKDKRQHALLIAGGVCWLQFIMPLSAALLVGAFIGIAREIINETGWSWEDIWADTVGLIVALFVCI